MSDNDKQSVLEFIEKGTLPKEVTTLERTTKSKYLFYKLVQHVRTRVKPKPQFFTYTAKEADLVKAVIEEHSIFDGGAGAFYVLEGFSQKFVDTLNPPADTYIVAETDDGMLRAPDFTTNRENIRGILKVLMVQMRIGQPLTLSGLLKLDWTGLKAFEEFEPILRRAKMMSFGEKEIEELLEGRTRANVLELTKRGKFYDVIKQIEQYGGASSYRQMLSVVGEILHYRSLRTMGYDEKKAAEQLGLGWRRAKEVEETHVALTGDDLTKLVDRAIDLDSIMLKNPSLGMQIYYLNNPISVRVR